MVVRRYVRLLRVLRAVLRFDCHLCVNARTVGDTDGLGVDRKYIGTGQLVAGGTTLGW